MRKFNKSCRSLLSLLQRSAASGIGSLHSRLGVTARHSAAHGSSFATHSLADQASCSGAPKAQFMIACTAKAWPAQSYVCCGQLSASSNKLAQGLPAAEVGGLSECKQGYLQSCPGHARSCALLCLLLSNLLLAGGAQPAGRCRHRPGKPPELGGRLPWRDLNTKGVCIPPPNTAWRAFRAPVDPCLWHANVAS